MKIDMKFLGIFSVMMTCSMASDTEKEDKEIIKYSIEKLREIGDGVRADPDPFFNARVRKRLVKIGALKPEEGIEGENAPVVEKLAPAAGSTESYQ